MRRKSPVLRSALTVALLVAVCALLASVSGRLPEMGTGSGAGKMPEGNLAPELRDALERGGAAEAVLVYQRILQNDERRAYGCHSEAHVLGQYAAAVQGADTVIHIAPGLCQGGFMHGVLQVAANQEVDAGTLCAFVDTEFRDGCAHGFGHLLAVRYPESMHAALRRCIEFYDPEVSESSKFVARCGGGVAMEYGTAVAREDGILMVDGEHSIMGPAGEVRVDLDAGELARPCSVLQEFEKSVADVKTECLLHLGLFMLSTAGEDGPRLYAACQRATRDAGELDTCLRSVGVRLVERRIYTGGAVRALETEAVVREACGGMAPDAQSGCAAGGYQSVFTQGPEFLQFECAGRWEPRACREALQLLTIEQRQ